MLSLGIYPTVTLAAARKQRAEAHELLADDIDPKEHRDDQSRASKQSHYNTIERIATQWLEIKKTDISPDHSADTSRSLELHVFPDMGKLPLHKITAITAIETLKPFAAKGSLETIKRLCQRHCGLRQIDSKTGNFQAEIPMPVTHQQAINFDELIVDLFSSGGGASTVNEVATGRPDIAINLADDAPAAHCANHADTVHIWRVYTTDAHSLYTSLTKE